MREYAVGDEPVPGYPIQRPLGAGGYGTVWVAKSPGDVEIALKIINLQGQGLKEFRAIGIVKRLRHPNLIPIYAFWLKDEYGNFLDSSAQDSVNLRGKSSELIIAMGLGDKSLAQRLEECKAAFAKRHGLPDTEASLIARLQDLNGSDMAGLPVEELLEYMFGSARAIDYLNQPTHSLGTGPPSAIQHCDIKPGNLLVVSNDVQVCDYGLARVTGDARKTQAAGTPAYMAPELIAGKPSSGTDQYSLAITYYELRTGRLPFDENLAFHAHITGELDFSLVTPIEQEILRRATHSRPDQRYPMTIEMVRALREAITPTRPPPPQSSSAMVQSVPAVQSPSGVYRAAGHTAVVSTPTIVTKPTVLDDLIRPGVELVPGHKLEQLLGRGGYGEVWAATMPGKTRCALKIVRNLDAVQGKQEFKSLDMIRDLDHDRLIRLQAYWLVAYDGSVIPDDEIGQPGAPKASGLVIATDLAQMNLLQRWQECHDQGQAGVPKEELVPYMHQSAEAIDYLNFLEPAIVHRDIKPENILLTKNHQVKVSDFGLAKLVEGTSAAINSASVGMTLAYAAPELFRNKVTRWTDQYSLALTYYRLRVGRLPFEDGMGPIQMMQAHASGTLDFSGVGEAEQAVLRRSCAVEPEARFGSCVEFAETLAAAVGLSRPTNLVPAVAQSHPVSSAAVGAGSTGPRWPVETGRQPAGRAAVTTQAPAGTDPRETLRFDDVKSPSTPPPGWPQSPPAHHLGMSSSDFSMPDQRRAFPGGLPSGIMETTTNVPSASDVDTAPDGSRQDWRESRRNPRPTGGGKRFALIAGVAVVVIAGGIGAFLLSRNTRGGDGGANTGGGEVATTTVAERQKTATSQVDAKVREGDFGAAARIVHDAVATEPEKVSWQSWAVERNALILPLWKKAAAAKDSSQARADELKQICQAYPSDADAQELLAKAAKDSNPGPTVTAVTDDQLSAALGDALARLKADDYAGCRAKLDAMKALGASPGNEVMRRAADLRERIDQLANEAKASPTEDAIADLAASLRSLGQPGKPEGEPLRDAYRRALAAKIAAVVPNLNDKTNWEKLLAACPLVDSGADPTAAWAVGCGAESAAELLAQKKPPAEDALAGIESALTNRKAADPTGGYLSYAQARLNWERRKDRTAAGQLLAIYPESGDVPPALAAPFRTAAAARVLEESAVQMRQADPEKPFKSDDVQLALQALKTSSRLAKGAMSPVGRLDLALAAWLAGDKATARQTADTFASAEARKPLSTADALAVLRIRAASQDDSTAAGQIAQIDSSIAIIELRRLHPKEVSDETINRTVIGPLLADMNRQTPDGAKAPRAKLLAEAAQFIQSGVRADPRTWKRLLGNADPWIKVRDLYAAAAALERRPEYVTRKIFASVLERAARGQGPTSESMVEADQIIKSHPKYAGAHTLRGELLHLRAVGEPDRAKQVADLTAAVKEFGEAEKLGATGAKASPDDLRWLYQSWSGACLLLGNFATDRTVREESIRAAATYAEKLKDQDPKYLEGRLAAGNAYEDVAYFLGDTDYFSQAVREFEDAKELATLPGEARPWLSSGRCQYRRAEKAPASPAERRTEAGIWLGLADTDLNAALAKLAESASPTAASLTAEAQYFLGQCHALRADFARAANKVSIAQEEAGKAEAAYEQAAAVAAGNDAAGRNWGQLIGVARCGVQIKLAQALINTDRRRAAEYLKLAKARAGDLRRYSPVAAALWEGSAMDLERYVKESTPQADAEIVKVFEKGLEGAGSRDLVDQYSINKRLAGWFSGGKLPGGRDWDKAFRALDAAARNARDADFDANLQAQTWADAAFCRINGLETVKDDATKLRYREDLLDRFRRALDTAPAHQFAWYWKLRAAADGDTPLAIAVKTEADATAAGLVKEARLVEELVRFDREAKATMPLDEEKRYPLFEKERKLANKNAKDLLDRAIKAAPKDPDVWMWQWALAEIAADSLTGDSNPEVLAEAKRRIAAAEAAMPADAPHLPGETRQSYRQRQENLQQNRERITQLRKDLEKQK